MDLGKQRDSPALICILCPQPQDGWLSQETGMSPRLPWPRVPAAGTDFSIPNQMRSERLGSGSHEVVICPGSITADLGRQVPAQPRLARLQ